MQWGAKADWLQRQADEGRELKAWKDRKEVLPHLSDLFEAFFDLSPGRVTHMGGDGYISLQEIVAYCDLTGITSPDDRHSFFRAIRVMDSAYLASRRERSDAEKEAKASASATKRGR